MKLVDLLRKVSLDLDLPLNAAAEKLENSSFRNALIVSGGFEIEVDVGFLCHQCADVKEATEMADLEQKICNSCSMLAKSCQ